MIQNYVKLSKSSNKINQNTKLDHLKCVSDWKNNSNPLHGEC